MHLMPVASNLSRASGFEKRAMTDTSFSEVNMRNAGALTGPCPPTKSTFCPCTLAPPFDRSEAEVEYGLVERRHVHLLNSRQQALVGKAGQEAVDGPLEVGDVALEPLVQPHVLESLRVQALLLPRQVREVLGGDRWPPLVVGLPDLGRRGHARFVALGVTRHGPDLHERLLWTERPEAIRGRSAVHGQHEVVREALVEGLVEPLLVEFV